MKKILAILFFMPPALLFSQIQKTGNLTFFLKDGDKFYLIFNGEKQNNLPQTNQQIEELTHSYYNAEIVFADSSIVLISKSNLALVDMGEKLMGVTYKIKEDKACKPKFNFYPATEVQKD